MLRSVLLFSLACYFVASASLAQVSDPDNQSVTAAFTEEAPVIDGLLDDAVWQRITPITDFVQRLPDEGAEPTEKSEMRIAFDEDNLYIGLIFYDSEPDKIRANIIDRGGRIDRDDHVWIAIDTYHDRRNAYLFEMNPLGTQDDATITDESMSMADWNWDAVYYSEGNIDENGWTLEVAIPFRQIRFSKDEEPEMGIAVQRTINRKNERAIWPFIPLNFQGGIIRVSQYATLRGLRGLHRGKNIEIKPYIITGAQEIRTGPENTESDFLRDIGVDFKYGITSNLTLDLTLNTDFAQVEADNVQLNLTRFSLFFPEKREFFLERQGMFAHGNSRSTETFFSRRIGITNDILAGARLTGQVGPLSIGLLNIQTKKEKDLSLPASNNAVARIRADVVPGTTVGAIFTNLEQGDDYNRAIGADVSVRFWQSSEFDAWITSVSDSEPGVSDVAGSASLRIANDLVGIGFGYTNVGRNYNPGLGFVRRRDMIAYSAAGNYSPRFGGGTSLIQQISFRGNASVIEGQDHRKQSSSVGGRARFSFVRRDAIDIAYTRSWERLDNPFFIRDAEIPADVYTTNSVALGGLTDQSRRGWVRVRLSRGDFWGGTRTFFGGSFGFRYSKHFKIEAGINHSIIDLPSVSESFDATTMTLVLRGATSRKLFANALIQYDNFSHDLQANIRVDWIHTPGSDLFFVFNTSYNFTGDDDQFDPRSAILNDRVGVAKVTYLVML